MSRFLPLNMGTKGQKRTMASNLDAGVGPGMAQLETVQRAGRTDDATPRRAFEAFG